MAQVAGAALRAVAERRARLVQALLPRMEGQPQAARQVVGAVPLQQGAGALRARLQGGAEVDAQRRHPPLQLAARGGHHFRRGGRGRGAVVRGQVAQGAVHLMADRGDDRRGGRRDGAHHALVRERQQLLQRAAAAGNDDDVAQAPAVGGAHAARDAGRGVGALHRRRDDHHVDAGVAAAQYPQQIAQRGAGGRGDHRHPPRQQR